MSFVYNSKFQQENAESVFGPPYPKMPSMIFVKIRGGDRPKNKIKTLTKQEEELFFLKYNYARWKSSTESDAGEFKRWMKFADYMEEFLVRNNLPLIPYATYLRHTLIRIIDNNDEVVSQCQQSLLSAVRNFDVERGRFSTQAMHCLFNIIISTVRRQKNKKECLVFDDQEYSVQNNKEIRDTESVDRLKLILRENLAGLSPSQHQLIKLRFVDGLTFEQIGVTMNRTQENQRKRLMTAIKKLKKYYDQHPSDEAQE
jgi:RNA polymerase sigma factor (sigma-70 family)